ncbi:hypothetical protein GCM10027265_03780 [Jatrophihabitans fulvus]
MATVLVDPDVLPDFELDLMRQDFRVWLVHTVPTFPDPQRLAFQLRRSLLDSKNGRWADAEQWTIVWVTFGDTWRNGDEPLPWAAHEALWQKLAEYAPFVHYNLGLGGVPRLSVPREAT